MKLDYNNKGLIILIAVILFILIHYLIKSSDDSDLINSVIERTIDECENEDFIYNMDRFKSNYLKNRFKTYILRGICFGILFGLSINLLNNNKNKDNIISSDINNSKIIKNHFLKL
jgi:hypothetical protein